MFAFEMTAEVAEEYFRRKHLLGAITEEQCTHILLQMVEEGLILAVEDTNETKEEYLKRVSKDKKVLHVKGKENENDKTKGEADSGETGTIGN